MSIAIRIEGALGVRVNQVSKALGKDELGKDEQGALTPVEQDSKIFAGFPCPTFLWGGRNGKKDLNQRPGDKKGGVVRPIVIENVEGDPN